MKPLLPCAFQSVCVFGYFLNYLVIPNLCTEAGSLLEWDWDGDILSLIFLAIFLSVVIIVILVY